MEPQYIDEMIAMLEQYRDQAKIQAETTQATPKNKIVPFYDIVRSNLVETMNCAINQAVSDQDAIQRMNLTMISIALRCLFWTVEQSNRRKDFLKFFTVVSIQALSKEIGSLKAIRDQEPS